MNSAASISAGYTTIQDAGVSLPQRNTLNFVNFFTITDNVTKTDVNINIAELEPALDLGNLGGLLDLSTQVTGLLSPVNIDITNLESTLNLANIAGQIDLTTQVTGLLPPGNIDITALEPLLNLANLGGQIDLTTQVTGVLPLANGGTGQALSDPGYDAAFVWDNTLNQTRLAQLSGLSYSSGSNTLTATGSGTINGATTSATFEDFINTPSTTPSTPGNIVGTTNMYATTSGAATVAMIAGEANHPGILQFITGILTDTWAVKPMESSIASISSANVDNCSFECVVRPNAAFSNGKRLLGFGFSGGSDPTTVNHVIAFISDAGNIYGKTRNAASANTTASTAFNAGTWYRLRVEVDAGASNASFYVDGTLLGTIAIPAGTSPQTVQIYGYATNTSLDIDYFSTVFNVTR